MGPEMLRLGRIYAGLTKTERHDANMNLRRLCPIFALAVALALARNASGQPATEKALPGHVPGVVSRLQASGRLPGTNNLPLAIGLPLRNRAELETLLAELYNPASLNFHNFLTPSEFTARFGPTEQD